MPIRFIDLNDVRAPVNGLDVQVFDTGVRDAAVSAFRSVVQSGVTPVVFDQAGGVDDALTAYARAIHLAVGSRGTTRAYAIEAEVFTRFLKEFSKTIWTATHIDIAAYRNFRRNGSPQIRVEKNSWNKIAVAIRKLFAVHRIHVSEMDWTKYRIGREDDGEVRMVPLGMYIEFRDNLLETRCFMRNTAFAEILLTTGMRCQEATAILRCEIPRVDEFGDYKNVEFSLSNRTTKGNKARKVRYSKRVARHYIDPYIDEERSNRVKIFIKNKFPRLIYREQTLNSMAGFLFFTLSAERQFKLLSGNGKWVVTSPKKLSVEERSKLIQVEKSKRRGFFEVVDVGALWLSESGTMIKASSWNPIFAKANDAMKTKSPRFSHITPHVLRHTFAVNTLNFLIRGLLEIRNRRGKDIDRRGEIYDHLVGDPLQTLQRMLGHSSLKSTIKYLRYVEDNQEIVDAAMNDWDLAME